MKTPLRIAILQCDTPAPHIVELYGAYDRIFTTLLEAAAPGAGLDPKKDLQLSAYDVVEKQEYPALEDVDAVLISGSKHNSFDSHPWILKLVSFTESILAQTRVRVIGVCFGHQILGRALGAPVARSPHGWEVAVLPVDLTEKGRQIFGVEKLAIHQMHHDAILTLPSSANMPIVSLGSSPQCSTQGMYSPGRLISVQGHPEFHEGIVRRLVEMRRDQGIFSAEVAGDALRRVGEKHDGVLIAEGFLRFLLEE